MLDTLRFIWSHPLAKRARIEALSRYVRWQLATRILNWPSVVPFVDDAKLVVDRGMHGATGNVYCGLHEFDDMGFLLHLLRPEDCFVDVGANVGSYTILASAVVGARSVCVEPVPDTFQLLQRNLRMNGLESLVLETCCAIGRQDEFREMSIDHGPANRIVQANYTGRMVRVPVRTLDSLLDHRPTTLWKIDVEGFESDVFAGAKSSLMDDALLAVIVETANNVVAEILADCGFQRASYEPLQRKLTVQNPLHTSSNQLWVRHPDVVAKRCESAPYHQVLSQRM